ncbi:YcxB family protein [Pseudoalteromonas luteoviolacea]|uniref:YcxB family protein n=1 Tax=Pseudoalteromonas luteoviolacea TaxID=43657 RepID=UPI001B399E8B|nr:YcxB family protein [Pseudoalteromonas luteoviolacea]MBQ4838496.1 YcxB family protein [Pseudoalteromonas luteoviolacea]
MIKTVTITKQDYLGYSDFVVKRLCTPKNQKSSGFLRNMIIWFLLTVIFLAVFQIKSVSFSDFHWQSALITAIPFSIFLVVFLYNINKIKKLSIPNENGVMIGEKTIEFQSGGINEIHHLGSCFYKWDAVEAIEENKGDLYIFVDKLMALIIPANSFESEAEKDELKALVQKYV